MAKHLTKAGYRRLRAHPPRRAALGVAERRGACLSATGFPQSAGPRSARWCGCGPSTRSASTSPAARPRRAGSAGAASSASRALRGYRPNAVVEIGRERHAIIVRLRCPSRGARTRDPRDPYGPPRRRSRLLPAPAPQAARAPPSRSPLAEVGDPRHPATPMSRRTPPRAKNAPHRRRGACACRTPAVQSTRQGIGAPARPRSSARGRFRTGFPAASGPVHHTRPTYGPAIRCPASNLRLRARPMSPPHSAILCPR